MTWTASQGARGCSGRWCRRLGWGTVGVWLGVTGTSHRSQVFPFECNYSTAVAISRWRVQRNSTEIINNLQTPPGARCQRASAFRQGTRGPSAPRVRALSQLTTLGDLFAWPVHPSSAALSLFLRVRRLGRSLPGRSELAVGGIGLGSASPSRVPNPAGSVRVQGRVGPGPPVGGDLGPRAPHCGREEPERGRGRSAG